ncbi:MAG TPA: glycosyltransferase [Terriglobales bacterium]|jgi:glycosyltransferase involved in cell wall biosynthesis|nr:glycosyltransferase [Terriglobales bacterium]
MHLFLNCLAASAASGLTYVRNVVPQLSGQPGVRATVALRPQLRQELGHPSNISFVELEIPAGAAGRFCWEQSLLSRTIRKSGADVLISAGNFALFRSPVPQILLSGNSLYTSPDFYNDLRARRAYRIWLDTQAKGFFARRSVRWADCTVAPSKSFADTLRVWSEGKVVSIYHGFDSDIFFCEQDQLPQEIQDKLDSGKDALRLIFVSHYNYYRNFETLLRAIPYIRERLGGRKVQLLLTCKLSSEENTGAYRTATAAALVRDLGISNEVVELGAIPYGQLQHVLRSSNIYVTPAYTETFAHPLVEAMASGLPIVASDLQVHREVCGPAALYFPCFSPTDLAKQAMAIANNQELGREMSNSGQSRSLDFSWARHVQELLAISREMTN